MALNLREIVSISGRTGLYRVVSPARNGILVESLVEPRTRTLVPTQQQVSSLGDISIYTTSEEGTVALADVLTAIRRLHGPQLDLTAKSDPQSLVTFIRGAVPDYDVDRVYLSDVKKLVTWYNILGPHLPDEATEDSEAAPETPEAAAEPELDEANDEQGKTKAASAKKTSSKSEDAAPAADEMSTGGAVPPQEPDSSEGKPMVQ